MVESMVVELWSSPYKKPAGKVYRGIGCFLTVYAVYRRYRDQSVRKKDKGEKSWRLKRRKIAEGVL